MWGLNKLYLLMEKQHNRGQDGAGIATVKLDVEPGYPFMNRMRSNASQAIADIFQQVGKEVEELEKYHPGIRNHPGLMKGHVNFLGELLLGHLRYGTQGKNKLEYCHPFINRDTIPARNLALAGNFNIVNSDELFALAGKEPHENTRFSDLAAMIELMHTYLCREDETSPEKLDIKKVLKKTLPIFDGGFHVGGLTGNGIGFVFRDAHGIRPSYYYKDDEVVVRHILRVPPVTDVEIKASMAKADTVRSKIIAGSLSFAAASSRYTEDEQAKFSGPYFLGRDGGPYVTIDLLDKDLVAMLGKLTPGEFSQPVVFEDNGKKGVRIVHYKSRTEPHRLNMKDDFSRISTMALEEKKQKTLEKWMKEKVPSYYIMIDDEIKSCTDLTKWIVDKQKAF